jgi:hypothetical protein
LAKPLIFQFGGKDFAFQLNKIDRSKLYGYKEMDVVADDGLRCELATLADDGCTVIGRGGTGIGQLTVDGLWSDKKKLKPIDIEGKPMLPVLASNTAPIPLVKKATWVDYLSHNIRLVYHLTSDGIIDELFEELKKGTLFSFPFSYRGGLVADAGFLLVGEDGNVFLAVGSPAAIEFIGLQQPAPVVEEETVEEEESDDMDFDMI